MTTDLDPSTISFTVSNSNEDLLSKSENPQNQHPDAISPLERQFQQLRFSNIDINELNDPLASFGVERYHNGMNQEMNGRDQQQAGRGGIRGGMQYAAGQGQSHFGNVVNGIEPMDQHGGGGANWGQSIHNGLGESAATGGLLPFVPSSSPIPPEATIQTHPAQQKSSPATTDAHETYPPPPSDRTKIQFTTTNTNPFTLTPETRQALAHQEQHIQRNKRKFQNQSTNQASRYMHARRQGTTTGPSAFTSDFHERRNEAERNARKWMDENIFEPIESTSTFQKLTNMGKKRNKKTRQEDREPQRRRTTRARTFGATSSGWYRPSQYDRPFSRHEAFVESLVNKYIQFRDLGAGNSQRENQLASDIIDRVEKYSTGVRRNQNRMRRGRYGSNGPVTSRNRGVSSTTQRLGRNRFSQQKDDEDDFTMRPMQNPPTFVVTSRLENAVGVPGRSTEGSLFGTDSRRMAPKRRIAVEGDSAESDEHSHKSFPPTSPFLTSKL